MCHGTEDENWTICAVISQPFFHAQSPLIYRLFCNHGAGENIEQVKCQAMRSELKVRECGSKGTVITAPPWTGSRIFMLTAYFCCFWWIFFHDCRWNIHAPSVCACVMLLLLSSLFRCELCRIFKLGYVYIFKFFTILISVWIFKLKVKRFLICTCRPASRNEIFFGVNSYIRMFITNASLKN